MVGRPQSKEHYKGDKGAFLNLAASIPQGNFTSPKRGCASSSAGGGAALSQYTPGPRGGTGDNFRGMERSFVSPHPLRPPGDFEEGGPPGTAARQGGGGNT